MAEPLATLCLSKISSDRLLSRCCTLERELSDSSFLVFRINSFERKRTKKGKKTSRARFYSPTNFASHKKEKNSRAASDRFFYSSRKKNSPTDLSSHSPRKFFAIFNRPRDSQINFHRTNRVQVRANPKLDRFRTDSSLDLINNGKFTLSSATVSLCRINK